MEEADFSKFGRADDDTIICFGKTWNFLSILQSLADRAKRRLDISTSLKEDWRDSQMILMHFYPSEFVPTAAITIFHSPFYQILDPTPQSRLQIERCVMLKISRGS